MGTALKSKSTRVRKARSAKSSAPPAPKSDITRLKGIAKPPSQLADLKGIRKTLSVAVSVVNVCVAALEAQAAHYDVDAAETLRRCASDPLFEQILRLDRLIAGGTS